MKFSPKALSLFFQSTISVAVPAVVATATATAASVSVSTSLQDERLLEGNLLRDLSIDEKHNSPFPSDKNKNTNKNKNVQKEDYHALFDSTGDNFTTHALTNSVGLTDNDGGNDGGTTGGNSNTNKNRSKRHTKNKHSGGNRSEQLERNLKKSGSSEESKSKSKSKESMSDIDKLKDKVDDLTNDLLLLQADIGVLNCVNGGNNNRERALGKQPGQTNLKPRRSLKKKRDNSGSNSKSSSCDDLNEEIAIVEQELADARAALIDAYVTQILTAKEKLGEDKQEFADNGCINNANGRVLRPSECQKLAEDIQEQDDDLALLEVEALAFFQGEQNRLVAEQASLETLQTTEDCASNSLTAECVQLAKGIAALAFQLGNLQADAEKAGLELEALEKKCLVNADTCFAGNNDDVLEWCTDNCKNCCLDENGEYSANTCDFAGILEVCEGACIGENACKSVGGIQTTTNQGAIGLNACVGKNACYKLGEDLATSITIGADSCTGETACYQVGEYSATAITIGAESCNSVDACLQLGKESANSIEVGSKSCTGNYACYRVGIYSATTITIGAESCNYEFACYQIGYYKATAIDVGTKSCTGEYACYRVGLYPATTITIGDESCKSEYACYQLGYSEATAIDVGGKSCTGVEACSEIGEDLATRITIGAESCNSDYACIELGQRSADTIDIGTKSCTGVNACYELGKSAFDSITVDDGSCTGVDACYRLGKGFDIMTNGEEPIDITTTTILVGAGSCLGADACDSVGIYAETVSIANGVCSTSNSCSDERVTFECFGDVNIDSDNVNDNSCDADDVS